MYLIKIGLLPCEQLIWYVTSIKRYYSWGWNITCTALCFFASTKNVNQQMKYILITLFCMTMTYCIPVKDVLWKNAVKKTQQQILSWRYCCLNRNCVIQRSSCRSNLEAEKAPYLEAEAQTFTGAPVHPSPLTDLRWINSENAITNLESELRNTKEEQKFPPNLKGKCDNFGPTEHNVIWLQKVFHITPFRY